MEILDILATRIIAYNKTYTLLTKSITGGLLLSQLAYWAKKMDWAEFYKTDAELIDETGMTLEQLKTAKKKISHLVDIKRKGIPARTHYKIKKGELLKAINSLVTDTNSVHGNPNDSSRRISTTNHGESQQLSPGNPEDYYREYAESTQKSTQRLERGVPPKKNVKTVAKPKSASVEAGVKAFVDVFKKELEIEKDIDTRTTQLYAKRWAVQLNGNIEKFRQFLILFKSLNRIRADKDPKYQIVVLSMKSLWEKREKIWEGIVREKNAVEHKARKEQDIHEI